MAILAIFAWISAAKTRARTELLTADVASATVRRGQDRGAALLFASPTMEDALAAVRHHLPPDLRLVSAIMADGRLSIAIETPDPDALRHQLRADPWFAGFRERGQSIGREGSIRVTFERPW